MHRDRSRQINQSIVTERQPLATMDWTMSKIPQNLDALLSRALTAAALTESGYPVRKATLATRATRGGGPPYRLFGRRPLYRWGDALAWAQSRCTGPHDNTSQHQNAARLADRPPPRNDQRTPARHGSQEDDQVKSPKPQNKSAMWLRPTSPAR
jgi:hypothetical protein